MAKYRRYGRRSSRGGKKLFGLGMKGLIPGLGILGLAGGIFFGQQLGSMIPVVKDQDPMIQSAAGGFILGGPAGALGAVVKNKFLGSSGSTSGMPLY